MKKNFSLPVIFHCILLAILFLAPFYNLVKKSVYRNEIFAVLIVIITVLLYIFIGRDEKKPFSTSRTKILLYTAVVYVIYSIYQFDSFSTWKFLAVFIPLAVSFIFLKKLTFFICLVVIIFFGLMLMSVGAIFNHDLLELTGPLVCPVGMEAKVHTVVQNPVPGETYTQARMVCVGKDGKTMNPGWAPHFVFFGLYLLAVIPLFLINVVLLKFLRSSLPNSIFPYICAVLAYSGLVFLIWKNIDTIINTIHQLLKT